ncbi:MAG: PilZ domain-containing protein, partial [Deltaproteobacteria bacterium]
IPLQRGQILMITIELEEELLEIGGRIIHVEPSLENFHSGVEFLQMDAKGERVLKNYLAAFKKGGF